MSWPAQWPAATQPAVLNPATPVINSAPAVVPPGIQYTPEQWAQLQQQNWNQWAQWQQQYQQWHQQYGAEYQKSMNALAQAQAQQSVAGLPNVAVPPPLPVEPKPPLPIDDPPPPVPSYNTAPPPVPQPPPQQQGYNTAPPPKIERPMNEQRSSVHYPKNNQNWHNQNYRQGPENYNKRPYDQAGDYHEPKRPMMGRQAPGWQNQPPPSKPRENIEELSEAEKKFDKQFAEWEAQFQKWKEQNVEHPDKEQYKEYEKKWESWRAQLLERREQMKRKRLGLPIDPPRKAGPGPNLNQGGNQSFNSSQQGQGFNRGQQGYNQGYNQSPSQGFNQQAQPVLKTGQNIAVKPDSGLLPTPVAAPITPFTKPPPNMNDEPLKFKDTKIVPELEENVGDFIKPNTGGGIPGLDLVKDDPHPVKKNSDDVVVIDPEEKQREKEMEKRGPDLDAISKGINTILGDQKLLNMLSMVSQTPIPKLSDNLTNTVSPMKDGPHPTESIPQQVPHPDQSNQSYEEQHSNHSEGFAQREFVNNFDDQTRSSFTMAPNEQETRFEGPGPYGRGPGQFSDRFDNFKGNRDNEFGRGDRFQSGPNQDRFGPRGDRFAPPDDKFGPNQDRFGPNQDRFGPNQDRFGPNQERFGPNQDRFGPNQDRFGFNQDKFGPNQNRFGPIGPNQDKFAPNQGKFGPNQDKFGPNQDKFGPNQDRFGLKQDRFGPNQDRFGKNQDRFGPNQDTFGSNQDRFGPNQDRFGSNQDRFGPNQDKFGPNQDKFGPNQDKFGPNQDKFGPNQDKFAPNQDRFGANQDKFGPNQDRFGPNQNRLGQDRFGSNENKFGPNQDRFGPNQNRYGPNQDRFGPGQDKFGSNQDKLGPNQDKFGPNKDKFGPNQDKFGANLDKFGPNQDKFGPNQDRFGPGLDRFGPGSNRFGPNQDKMVRGPNKFGPNQDRFGPNNDRFGPNQDKFGPNKDRFGDKFGSNQDRFGPRNDSKGPGGPRGQFGLDSDDNYQEFDEYQQNQFEENLDEYDYDSVAANFEEDPVSTVSKKNEKPWQKDPGYQQEKFNEPPPNIEMNAPTPPQIDGIFQAATVIDYDHKSSKSAEPEVLIEPIFMFDYRHKALSRIPLPQRPKWLTESVRGIREFDPPLVRAYEPNLRRYPSSENWRNDGYQKNWPQHRGRGYDERRPYNDRPYEEPRGPKKGYSDKDYEERRQPIQSMDFEEEKISDTEWPDDDEFEQPEKQNAHKFQKPNENKSGGLKTTLIEDLISPPGRYKRPPRIVIILRGPPGSGKTFLAKLIKDKEVENGGSAPRILSLDDYFMVEQEKEVTEEGKKVKVKEMVYEYEAEMEESYRTSLIKSFKKTITDGYFSFIIVDNINDKVKYFGEMWSFAKQNGFQVYICQLDLDVQTCSKRNIHGRSEADIEKCVADWEATPSHHPVLDATSLLQAASIPEVEMEEVNSPESDLNEPDGSEDQVARSKWDNFDCSVDNLAKLDGVSKPLRHRTMEEYLQLDTEWTIKPTKPGQKRVRWADLEEQKQQEKMRAIGFVVGHTNWDRMMDPTGGSSALTQTKYIERTGRYKVDQK